MKVCIVTGVARGIGNAIAERFLMEGSTVLGTARRVDAPAVIALKKRFPDSFHSIPLAVDDQGSAMRAGGEAARLVDHADLLVNNAAICPQDTSGPIELVDEKKLLDAFDVNTVGPFRCVKAFLPLLRKSSSAKVVMISSTSGSIASTREGHNLPYCVSKAALNMLVVLLGHRLRPEGIPVYAVHPGWVRTDMGGTEAPLSIEESVSGLVRVFGSLQPGGPTFVDYQGQEVPW